MKINLKLRLKNKATLIALTTGIIALIYQIIAIFGIVPHVSEPEVIKIAGMAINMFVLLGVVVDPTTDGIGDSIAAMSYATPKSDVEDFDMEYEEVVEEEE